MGFSRIIRASAFLLAALGVALFAPRLGGANPITKSPPWVVKANGNIFGFFISDLGGDIVIGLEDPNDGNTIPLQIRHSSGNLYFEGNEPRTFYSGLNCTGTVYVPAPADSTVKARTALLGKTYTVGTNPANGNNVTVFKGTGAGSTPSIQSTFINGVCNSPGSIFGTVTAATALINITTNFPPPYTLE